MDGDAARPDGEKIGRFRVTADAAKVAGFAASVTLPGAPPSPPGHIPATFPACWLTQPEIRQALTDAVAAHGAGANTILVHLGQSIDYQRPLLIDHGYWVDLDLKPGGEKRLKLEASIIDDEGAIVAVLVGSFHMAELTASAP